MFHPHFFDGSIPTSGGASRHSATAAVRERPNISAGTGGGGSEARGGGGSWWLITIMISIRQLVRLRLRQLWYLVGWYLVGW